MFKNTTFIIGLTLLYVGALFQIAPDWDYGVSTLMAVCTYWTAENTVRSIMLRRWKRIPRVLFDTWFAVDGSYTVYWYFIDQSALMMRDIQWPVSLCMYLICGLLWLLGDAKPLTDPAITRSDLIK